MPPEPFDENAQHLDAWTADPERQREDFFLSDSYSRAHTPSAWPEYLLLATLGAVCAVLVYFALKVTL